MVLCGIGGGVPRRCSMVWDARLSGPRALPDAILRGGGRDALAAACASVALATCHSADELAADDVFLRAAKPYKRRKPAAPCAACQSAQAAPRWRDRHPCKDVQCPP